jgi:hypothetical protein
MYRLPVGVMQCFIPSCRKDMRIVLLSIHELLHESVSRGDEISLDHAREHDYEFAKVLKSRFRIPQSAGSTGSL